jgi:hypothetical protein
VTINADAARPGKLGEPACRQPWESFHMHILTVLFVLTWAAMGLAQDQTTPGRWLAEAEAAHGAVTNYTAIFHKQQRIDATLLQEEVIFIKFREPLSLYMRWVDEPDKGAELLYVEGWNGNRARAHQSGVLGLVTWNLCPRDPRLMSDNLHPLTYTGIKHLVMNVASNVHRASKAGELGFHNRGEEMVYGLPTRILEIVLPRDEAKGYSAYRMIINQDLASKILIRIRIYDWKDQLFEHYGYQDIELDAGLTDADFDPDNPDYHF